MKKIAFIFIVFVCGCADEQDLTPTGPITTASAEVFFVSTTDGTQYSIGEQAGTVLVTFQDDVTTLLVRLSNMTPNSSHAMHLHQGTLETPSHHWNQGLFTAFCNTESLGSIWAKPFAGDVGNIDIDENGAGTFVIETDLWSLNTNTSSDILNTVLFIHENEEDFLNECDPNHEHNHEQVNAKIAGGTILLDEEELQ
jgi:Cu-Zn family superoxide dismutase